MFNPFSVIFFSFDTVLLHFSLHVRCICWLNFLVRIKLYHLSQRILQVSVILFRFFPVIFVSINSILNVCPRIQHHHIYIFYLFTKKIKKWIQYLNNCYDFSAMIVSMKQFNSFSGFLLAVSVTVNVAYILMQMKFSFLFWTQKFH